MEINELIKHSKNSLSKIYEKHKVKLGATKYSELINELQVVYTDHTEKREALPKKPGVLDANSQDDRSMLKERDLKVLLIKQKYGI